LASGDRHYADAALITALAAGNTVERAAASAGVSVRTAHRRLADPDFRAALDAAKRDLLERATAALTAASTAAVDALVSLLTTGPPAVKLGAAVKIIELGAQLRTALEVDSRLSALEAWMAESPQTVRRIR
jgi:hypothetical protein